jgi:hypothetical protein
MRELAANRKAEMMVGVRRSHAQQIMDEEDSENEGGDNRYLLSLLSPNFPYFFFVF